MNELEQESQCDSNFPLLLHKLTTRGPYHLYFWLWLTNTLLHSLFLTVELDFGLLFIQTRRRFQKHHKLQVAKFNATIALYSLPTGLYLEKAMLSITF